MPEDQVGGVPMKDYVDAQVAELRAAIGMLDPPKSVGVPLREHIEALFDERDRAQKVAEQEREKAARALRIELDRAIDEGDTNLKDHIEQQIHQIREALLSSEKLELARIDAVSERQAMMITTAQASFEERIDAVQREQLVRDDASEKAIEKAETANEKRFASVNEFRDSLSDQTASFLPREVAEAQFAELRRSIQESSEGNRRAIQDLTDKVNKLV